MTVQFKCNGPECSRVMAKNEFRIGLLISEPPKPIDLETEPQFQLLDLSLDHLGDSHFCSPECLTSWGYAAALERMNS